MIQIKTMPRLFVLCLFVLSSVFANANSDDDLLTLKSMMPKVCHLAGEFSQSKQIKSIPVPLVSKGEFVYSCDFGLIWKTLTPVTESLVFSNKKHHFLVQDKFTVENLDGVQHYFLADLLLGLMSGNTEFIAKEFELSTLSDVQKGLTLQPKNKMVKQAIQSVVLKKLDDTNNKNALEITITDKNQQTTKIISSEKQQFANHDDFSISCMSLSTSSCKLLFNPVRINTSGQN